MPSAEFSDTTFESVFVDSPLWKHGVEPFLSRAKAPRAKILHSCLFTGGGKTRAPRAIVFSTYRPFKSGNSFDELPTARDQ